MNMKRSEAENSFWDCLEIISRNFNYLKDGDVKKFLDESLEALYLIERMKDEFFDANELELTSDDYQDEEPLHFVVFMVLSGLDAWEIFEKDYEFICYLEESGEMEEELASVLQSSCMSSTSLETIVGIWEKFNK